PAVEGPPEEVLRIEQARSPAPEDHADARPVLAVEVEARLRDGLGRRGEPHAVRAREAPLLGRAEETVGDLADLRGRLRAVGGGVEERDGSDPAPSLEQVLPELRHTVPDRRDCDDTRDRHATLSVHGAGILT